MGNEVGIMGDGVPFAKEGAGGGRPYRIFFDPKADLWSLSVGSFVAVSRLFFCVPGPGHSPYGLAAEWSLAILWNNGVFLKNYYL